MGSAYIFMVHNWKELFFQCAHVEKEQTLKNVKNQGENYIFWNPFLIAFAFWEASRNAQSYL